MERTSSFKVEFWDCPKCLSQNEIDYEFTKYLDLGIYVSELECVECKEKVVIERAD